MHAATLRISRRQIAGAPRRFASTNSTAQAQASAAATASAVKAKETAALAANKAMEILAKSSQTLTRLATTTGGRTGSLLKAVECNLECAHVTKVPRLMSFSCCPANYLLLEGCPRALQACFPWPEDDASVSLSGQSAAVAKRTPSRYSESNADL